MPEFSLQTVLEYRHSLVEGLEIELSVLMNKEQEIQIGIETMNATKASLLEEMKEIQKGNLNLDYLNQMRNNVKFLKRQIKEQHKVLEEIGEEIAKKREELITAKQDEEVLMKLKEKVMSEFEEKIKKADSVLQDDIYIAQAFQRSQNNKTEDINA